VRQRAVPLALQRCVGRVDLFEGDHPDARDPRDGHGFARVVHDDVDVAHRG
jgi:hypothetical protein